jgi:streptomycin 6-kinase
MNIFEKNILSVYREKGRVWLNQLPKIIKQLEEQWGLRQLEPLNHLTFNYVLSGVQNETPIILKLSLDQDALDREVKALQAFKGFGAAIVLDAKENALLLQRALPGHPLRKNPLKIDKKPIEIACEAAKKLHQAPFPKKNSFPHIEEWLKTLEKEWNIPKEHLQLARALKKQLLAHKASRCVLLHGDLHQNNIISDGDNWLVIDPKGVIGFPINEIWAFVEDLDADLRYISGYFDYPLEDVIKWYYVHLVLAACWQAEDNLDATLFLHLADQVLPMLR